MTWVRIVDIHPEDAFYGDRHELIGKKMELLREFPHCSERGWKAANLQSKNGPLSVAVYEFYAVKFIPEAEWQELHKDHILASVGKFDAPQEPIDEELRKDHITESFR